MLMVKFLDGFLCMLHVEGHVMTQLADMSNHCPPHFDCGFPILALDYPIC
jgi:hypothetical protein